MAQTLTEKEVQDLMKLNKNAIDYLKLDMTDILLAQDITEATKQPQESPAQFHTRRREAITRVVEQCRNELQVREDKLLELAQIFNYPKPKNEDVEAVKTRELNELVNGKYPITLYVNQIFNIIAKFEKEITLLDILPKPSERE